VDRLPTVPYLSEGNLQGPHPQRDENAILVSIELVKRQVILLSRLLKSKHSGEQARGRMSWVDVGV
jgi:hypothetical protein